MHKLVKTFFLSMILSLFSIQSLHCEEVMGIGAPLMDLLIPVEESFLEEIQMKKGDSRIVDQETFNKILNYARGNITIKVGGSCASTIRALSLLGKQCSLVGTIGNDEMGQLFLHQIRSEKIEPKFITSTTPTGMVACLITPDGERTMSAFPGASLELSGSHLSLGLFRKIKHVHIEGYAFTNDSLVITSARLAKEAGALVSLDLASIDKISHHRDEMNKVIKNYIDITFGNEEESKLLTNTDSPEEACKALCQWSPYADVLVGKDGCWVGHNGEAFPYPTTPVPVVDTTGAGDFFASGFLYGFLTEKPLSECARLGNLLGGAVVQVVGAEIPEPMWQEILSEL